MKRKPTEDVAEIISFEGQDHGALNMARRRITPIVRAWAAFPAISGLDVFWLAVSCYLQGTLDGFEVAERNQQEQTR